MRTRLRMALVLGAALPLGALAQDASVPRSGSEKTGARETKIVQALLTRYLDAVKAKHWGEAKQLVHPKTLSVIAERKRRLGREEHAMAPWHYEKKLYYLTGYRIAGTRFTAGAFVVDVKEDNYQVRERVVVEGEPASYLVGKFHGQWYVVDKLRGETFNDESIKLGYPGYFDKLQFPREEEEED